MVATAGDPYGKINTSLFLENTNMTEPKLYMNND
jgi:hypothetical protein